MYNAIIARIRTRPLEGSDNIILGSCQGYQVIVGKNTEDGQLGIFFEQGGQLSEGFAEANNLVRKKDENGNNIGGYFEENRRVKAVKMRGAKSEGFFCEISALAYTGYDLSKLKEGEEFDTLNGHAICNKYVTPATMRAQQNKQGVARKKNVMFKEHVDTDQFKRNYQSIPVGSVIYITEKVHGTSFRYGHVMEETEIYKNKISKFLSRILRLPQTKKEWIYLNGSRRVVLERRQGLGFYGKEEFRFNATKGIALHKGEVLYGELAGYTETGSTIMEPQDNTKLKDKNIEKNYGKTMVYRYGSEEGTCKVFIYRITQVNEDGVVTELSWPQVQQRCAELGLTPVPTLRSLFLTDHEELNETVKKLTETEDSAPYPSTIDQTHIMEGVVVRYESSFGTGFLKNKCFTFGLLEGYLKENEEFVDMEEMS